MASEDLERKAFEIAKKIGKEDLVRKISTDSALAVGSAYLCDFELVLSNTTTMYLNSFELLREAHDKLSKDERMELIDFINTVSIETGLKVKRILSEKCGCKFFPP
jgi:hypothetical protein